MRGRKDRSREGRKGEEKKVIVEDKKRRRIRRSKGWRVGGGDRWGEEVEDESKRGRVRKQKRGGRRGGGAEEGVGKGTSGRKSQ